MNNNNKKCISLDKKKKTSYKVSIPTGIILQVCKMNLLLISCVLNQKSLF